MFTPTLGKSVIELVTSLGAPRAEVRVEALDALIATPAPGAWQALLGCLTDPEPPVRVRAARALAALERAHGPAPLPQARATQRALRTACNDPTRMVRAAARDALLADRPADDRPLAA